jgi:hypothetical protein
LLAEHSDADAWHAWPEAAAVLSPAASRAAASAARGAAVGVAVGVAVGAADCGPLLSRRAAQCAALVAAVDGHDCIAHGAALKAPRLAKCFGGLDPVRYFDAAAVEPRSSEIARGCAWVRFLRVLLFLKKEADWWTSL